MKHLSRMDIEAIAEKYIRKYMELPEVQERTVYRIEPELFLTNVLGLNIGYFHLSYKVRARAVFELSPKHPISTTLVSGIRSNGRNWIESGRSNRIKVV